MSSIPLVKRRAEQVLDILRERLAQHDATQGSRLPPERILAAELNVGRRTLREALQILEDENLIQRQPGRGTVILSKNESSHVPARLLADIRKYTSPLELMEARLLLEPAIASMAAVHATSHDIDEMRRCIEQCAVMGADHQQWEKSDSAFHASLGKATHNTILILFLSVLTAAREQTAWGRLRKTSLTPRRQSLYIEQHKSILSAIEERDPEQAANIMRQHLSTVRRTLIDQLDEP